MADPRSPEDSASRNEVRRRLEAAIDLLPPIYRCVFILRAVADLSVEDTAASLRVSRDVVKTRYLRARAMLRRQLDGAGEAALCDVHDFMGPRCDQMVRRVLARLRAAGVVRDGRPDSGKIGACPQRDTGAPACPCLPPPRPRRWTWIPK